MMYSCFCFLIFSYLSLGSFAQLVCRDGQLALDSDNLLWACSVGQWGTVCGSDSFGMDEAMVACRNLGYSDDSSGITYETVGGGTGFTALGALDCSGSEEYLHECVQAFDWLNTCDHSMDVKLTCPSTSCTNGQLRLFNGFSSNEGTLEICKNGAWNTICMDEFGGQEAYVACRQLGLNASTAELQYTPFSTGHGWAQHTKFRCRGTEETLMDCNYTLSDSCLSYSPYSGHVAIAQLTCSGDPAPGNCFGSGIRVNDRGVTSVTGMGRLELCQNGAWGTVNNNMFSVKDSLVACRQMGVPSPSTQVYPQGYFENNAAGPIILRDLVCLGSESSLYTSPPLGCNPNDPTYDLDHSTDVFINCWTKVGVSCNDGDVRIVNGTNKDEGRVEVCLGEEWGTFCDTFWDRREAQVICRQLGYPNSYGAFYLESKFGTGYQVPYFYTDLNCTGSENGIVSCDYSNQIEGEKCLFGRAVGVKCYNNTGCTEGAIRLANGNQREGDVQICRNGVWGYVCGSDWSEKEAMVVCSSQGYSNQQYSASSHSLFGGSQDDAPIVYDALTCTGNEDQLSACAKSEYASLYPTCLYVASVTCLPNDGCTTNGDLRLQDGTVASEGRLEVCNSGSWTTFKASTVDYRVAQVVCRQLGYDPEWSVSTEGNTWGTGNRMLYYDTITCTGSEQTINECARTSITQVTDAIEWYNYERAGVSCESKISAETCIESGAVRLKDGPSAREGRLEICLNNYWGSVCNRGWGQREGLVACRQAGYETLRPLMMSSSFSTRMNGPVNVYNIQCNGHESQLSDCAWWEAVGESSCSHGDDVGLYCAELPEVYSEITISASATDPFPLESEVMFTCEGAPDTGDIYYSWSMDDKDLWVSGPSVTVTIGTHFRKWFNMYCNVYRSNEKVGGGMKTFSVRDLLWPTQEIIYLTGEDIAISFQRQDTAVNGYLSDLTWTYEGVKVNTSDPRYSFSDDWLTLTISSAGLSDVGVYSIQYNGLGIPEQNDFCEDTTLSFLRDYPILSSAYSLLTVPGFFTDVFDTENHNRILLQTYDVINFTLGEPVIVIAAYRFGTIPTEAHLQPEWYFNGAQYISTTETNLRDHIPVLDHSIANPVLFDSGYYEIVLKYPYKQILTGFQCSLEYGSSYVDFMHLIGFEDDYLIADTATIEVRYNEKPTAQITATTISFASSEDVTIVCAGSGGYPRFYNVSIWKNGVVLKQSTSASVEHNTADTPSGVSKYGDYTCYVNNMLLDDQVTLRIANEENFVWPFSNVNCFDVDFTVQDVKVAVINRLKESCSGCSFDESDLIDTEVTCPQGSYRASINTTLVYTNADGSLTASTLLQMVTDEFNNMTNRIITVNGVDRSVVIGPPEPKESFQLSDGAAIGITFAGGFLAGAITIVGIIVIVYFKFFRQSDESVDSGKSSGTGRQGNTVSFHNTLGESDRNKQVNIEGTDDIEEDFEVPPYED